MKYHYEYEVYVSNQYWRDLLKGRFRSREEAEYVARRINSGVFSIRKVRVYNTKED